MLHFRRTWLFLMLILLASSCRNAAVKNEALLFWCSNNNQEIKLCAAFANSWNQNNIHKVHMQPVPEGQSSEEVILAAVVGKTTPDIYSNMWQGDVEDFARAGVLIALDTLDGFLDFMFQRCDTLVVREITSTDGHIYQIPWKVNPIMMMYNPVMFKEAGVNDVPIHYSMYLDAGAKIKTHAVEANLGNQWLGISEVSPIWWQRFFNFLPLYYACSGGAPLV